MECLGTSAPTTTPAPPPPPPTTTSAAPGTNPNDNKKLSFVRFIKKYWKKTSVRAYRKEAKPWRNHKLNHNDKTLCMIIWFKNPTLYILKEEWKCYIISQEQLFLKLWSYLTSLS